MEQELLEKSLLGFVFEDATRQPAQGMLIRPRRAAYHICAQDSFIQRAAHYPYFTVHILFSGCALVDFEGEQHLLKAGDAFFIFPGQKHAYYNTEQVGYLWIELDYPGYLELSHQLNGQLVVHGAQSEQFQPALLAVLAYLRDAKPMNSYTLSALCYTFIMRIAESVQQIEAPSRSPLVQEVAGYIAQHFREDLSLDGLASTFHVSKSSLSKQFHKQMQRSMGHYITDKRLEYAILQLKTTKKSCAEIATELGFYDAAHLNKAFRARLHILPSDFRKRGEG